MSQPLRFYAEMAVREGNLGALKEALKGPIETTRSDPNTLEYLFFLNDDQTVMHAIETYRDSDAFLAHMAAVGPSLQALFAAASLTKLVVMGDASQAVKDALAPMNAIFVTLSDGFAR